MVKTSVGVGRWTGGPGEHRVQLGRWEGREPEWFLLPPAQPGEPDGPGYPSRWRCGAGSGPPGGSTAQRSRQLPAFLSSRCRSGMRHLSTGPPPLGPLATCLWRSSFSTLWVEVFIGSLWDVEVLGPGAPPPRRFEQQVRYVGRSEGKPSGSRGQNLGFCALPSLKTNEWVIDEREPW